MIAATTPAISSTTRLSCTTVGSVAGLPKGEDQGLPWLTKPFAREELRIAAVLVDDTSNVVVDFPRRAWALGLRRRQTARRGRPVEHSARAQFDNRHRDLFADAPRGCLDVDAAPRLADPEALTVAEHDLVLHGRAGVQREADAAPPCGGVLGRGAL